MPWSHGIEPATLAEAWLGRRGLPEDKLSPGARQALLARDWPGNVRELENALKRAVADDSTPS